MADTFSSRQDQSQAGGSIKNDPSDSMNRGSIGTNTSPPGDGSGNQKSGQGITETYGNNASTSGAPRLTPDDNSPTLDRDKALANGEMNRR